CQLRASISCLNHSRFLASMAHQPFLVAAGLSLHPARRQPIRHWSDDFRLVDYHDLGGLWHGARLNFLLWGFWHGLALVVAHAWHRSIRLRGTIPRPLSWALTMAVVFYGWLLFRGHNVGDLWQWACR